MLKAQYCAKYYKNWAISLIFLLVALIGLRHYHKKFEAYRCKNGHLGTFWFFKFWLLSNFSVLGVKYPFFSPERSSYFFQGFYLINIRIISEQWMAIPLEKMDIWPPKHYIEVKYSIFCLWQSRLGTICNKILLQWQFMVIRKPKSYIMLAQKTRNHFLYAFF